MSYGEGIFFMFAPPARKRLHTDKNVRASFIYYFYLGPFSSGP